MEIRTRLYNGFGNGCGSSYLKSIKPHNRLPTFLPMKTVKNTSAVSKAGIKAVRKAKANLKKRPKKNKRKDELIGKLSHDMFVDVLTKLPIKKLFQCMCVSKVWRSIILQPWFHTYYRLRNCGLIIRVNDICPSFWYSSLKEEAEKVVNYPDEFFKCLTVHDDYRRYNKRYVTQTINGFFCVFFVDNESVRLCESVRVCRVFLFSVWRGEIMELPVAGFQVLPRYYFGFEPVNNVYKLLAIPEMGEELRSGLTDCHILTLNLNSSSSSSNTVVSSWKKLPNCHVPTVLQIQKHFRPPSYMQSFCVNGILFWLYPPRSLFSFDLKEEKFRSVHPPQLNSYHFISSWITQFRGRMALFKWDSDVDELVLYTLDDKDGYAWTKHVTCLPSELRRSLRSDIFDDDQGYIWTNYVKYLPKELRRRLMDFHLPIVVPIGNLPTGELLLTNATSEDPFTTVYSYDHKNNSFKRLVVGKFPQSVVFRRCLFGGQVANVISCVEPDISHVDLS